jgi:hypothetical protein
VSPHALAQAAQDAAWVLCFRQGTQDSDLAARLLGAHRVNDASWSYGYDVREHVRVTEQPIVPASVLEDLTTGTAYLRVPPIQRKHARVEPVRVALPTDAAARNVQTVNAPTDAASRNFQSLEPGSTIGVLRLDRVGGRI